MIHIYSCYNLLNGNFSYFYPTIYKSFLKVNFYINVLIFVIFSSCFYEFIIFVLQVYFKCSLGIEFWYIQKANILSPSLHTLFVNLHISSPLSLNQKCSNPNFKSGSLEFRNNEIRLFYTTMHIFYAFILIIQNSLCFTIFKPFLIWHISMK